jgi:hypothetical protein
MNIIYKNFRNILIVLLIAAVVLMRVFQPTPVDLKEYIKIGGKEYELLSKKVDTVLVPVHDTIPEYVPKYIKGKTEYIPVPANVDTLAILKDYYTKYSYNDTVKVNTYGSGIISDEVTQNKIVNRSIIWDLKIPIVKETITVKELPKNQIYIGGGVGLDKVNLFNQVSAGFLLKTKSDKIYGVSVGISNTNINSLQPEITPFIEGSLYWKIRLRKE